MSDLHRGTSNFISEEMIEANEKARARYEEKISGIIQGSAIVGGSTIFAYDNTPVETRSPSTFTTDGVLIGIPQSRNIYHPDPYLAPDNTIWVSQGAYEQYLHLRKAKQRIEELELELTLLKGKNLVSRHISGEFSTQDVKRSLEIWPSNTETWPTRITIIDSICSFCGSNWFVLEVDNSEGEYTSLSICQKCMNDAFNAIDRKVIE